MMCNVSVNLPKELKNKLTLVAQKEERAISYYLRKGLERILEERLEDIEDYEDAKKAYDEFLELGEETVPFEAIKKELNL